MSNKVNGKALPGENLTGNLQFFSVTTTVDISGTTAQSQKAFDRLIEIISLNGQPVILGPVTVDGSDYSFRFATEHAGAWASADALVAAIEQHGKGIFDQGSVTVEVSDMIG
jgi:hypothetical protein